METSETTHSHRTLAALVGGLIEPTGSRRYLAAASMIRGPVNRRSRAAVDLLSATDGPELVRQSDVAGFDGH